MEVLRNLFVGIKWKRPIQADRRIDWENSSSAVTLCIMFFIYAWLTSPKRLIGLFVSRAFDLILLLAHGCVCVCVYVCGCVRERERERERERKWVYGCLRERGREREREGNSTLIEILQLVILLSSHFAFMNCGDKTFAEWSFKYETMPIKFDSTL